MLASMSLDQLSYFVAVAEEQHLTRAAKRLHVSQPPLSRQIQQLEDELGVQLFERTPKGMRLLPTGETLLTRAKHILGLVEQVRTELTGNPLSAAPQKSPDCSS